MISLFRDEYLNEYLEKVKMMSRCNEYLEKVKMMYRCNEYLEKVKLRYRFNTEVFISPFQGAMRQGAMRQGAMGACVVDISARGTSVCWCNLVKRKNTMYEEWLLVQTLKGIFNCI